MRALRTGAAQPVLPAREWTAISRYADPVIAREQAVAIVSDKWQWTPLPTDYARTVTASGVLPLVTELLVLGGAHVGRCARRARGVLARAGAARLALHGMWRGGCSRQAACALRFDA